MLAHDARWTYWTVDERAALAATVAKQVRYQRRKEARRKGATK